MTYRPEYHSRGTAYRRIGAAKLALTFQVADSLLVTPNDGNQVANTSCDLPHQRIAATILHGDQFNGLSERFVPLDQFL